MYLSYSVFCLIVQTHFPLIQVQVLFSSIWTRDDVEWNVTQIIFSDHFIGKWLDRRYMLRLGHFASLKRVYIRQCELDAYVA